MKQLVSFVPHRLALAPTLLILTLGLVGLYTFGLFSRALVLGFDWNRSDYEVVWAIQSVPVRPGDRLIQLGSIRLPEFTNALRRSLLDEAQPGHPLRLIVERDGTTLTLDYIVPGVTPEEFGTRFLNQIWLAWLFWIMGLLTYLLVYPRDTRWRLLIAFFCVTAIWLSASTLSRLHLWESAIVLRMSVWLSVPIYWHLHWIFPERSPALRRWPRLRVFGYLAAIGLTVLEWLQLLPIVWYTAGFVLAFLGLFIPGLVRALSRTPVRQGRVLWRILLVAVAPAIVLGVFAGLGGSTLNALVALLGLPLLPFGYFYTAYSPQLGWLELRANRLITLFLFGLMLAVGAALSVPFAMTRSTDPGAAYAVPVLSAVVLGVAAAVGFPAFQRWVERRLLSIPLPPRHLLGHFLASITTSLDRSTLTRVLSEDILPSLQITQSALLMIADDQRTEWLYTRNAPSAAVPEGQALGRLFAQAGYYRAPVETEALSFAWVRVILRLTVEEKTVGLWLLGRRDPDDLYTQSEIEYLQVIANQTALTLTTLAQTEQLRQLYQADIDQHESERTQLARDLHDVVLNSLAGLRQSVGPTPPPGFSEAYDRAVSSLRQTISGLRPPLLDYGLYQALKALASDHEYRDDPLPALTFAVAESVARYDSKVEEQIYRIVQQAYDNVLQHARAETLTVRGLLEPGCIDLWVEDDGIGLAAQARATRPDEHAHFGLRGMHERAALIGAELAVSSIGQQGTRVHIRWSANGTRQGLAASNRSLSTLPNRAGGR
jgi:hypothetical protein